MILQQFEEVLEKRLHQSQYLYHNSWTATVVAVLLVMALVIFCCCYCNCSWLLYIGRFCSKPRRRSCCGYPSICITNHNKRVNVTEDQMVRLGDLRQRCERSPDRQSVCSRGTPLPPRLPSVGVNNETINSETRSRRVFQT